MKIIRNSTKNEVAFSSIPNGTVFIWNNRVFIKCCNDTSAPLNAVDLTYGYLELLNNHLVIPCYNAALHLNEQSQIVE
jgi:hypothetical protein